MGLPVGKQFSDDTGNPVHGDNIAAFLPGHGQADFGVTNSVFIGLDFRDQHRHQAQIEVQAVVGGCVACPGIRGDHCRSIDGLGCEPICFLDMLFSQEFAPLIVVAEFLPAVELIFQYGARPVATDVGCGDVMKIVELVLPGKGDQVGGSPQVGHPGFLVAGSISEIQDRRVVNAGVTIGLNPVSVIFAQTQVRKTDITCQRYGAWELLTKLLLPETADVRDTLGCRGPF